MEESWTLLGLEHSARIHRISLHPTDANVAYVGAMGPAWSDGQERGVFKTTDGGITWERILFVDARTGVSDMVMDPTDPEKLFVGMWSFRGSPWLFETRGPGSGLYVTRDGGGTWARLEAWDGLPQAELGRIGLAVSPSAPHVVYALVEAAETALLRSADGGLTWRTVRSGRGTDPQPFFTGDIIVDPRDEQRIFQLHSRTRSEARTGVRASRPSARRFIPTITSCGSVPMIPHSSTREPTEGCMSPAIAGSIGG